MKLKLMSFGIARDILGEKETLFEVGGPKVTIGDLKQGLLSKFPAFEDLKYFTMAVNQEYREDDFMVNENDEIVIIPPVSGG